VTVSYGLDCDVAGAGKHRGGLGIQRVMEVAADVITVSVLADRAKVAPWGLFGGHEGSRARIELKRANEPEFRTFQEALNLVSPSKFSNVRMYTGDQVRLTNPSGGGYGDPLERDPLLVARDVHEGFVSRRNADALYGVVLDEGGEPDLKATQLRRREMRDGLANA
jgi:N-methylhydantoinase B/oxoprolinase/acetone carboxylase alpha subunit